MNPPSTNMTAQSQRKLLAQVIAYHILLFVIMLGLLTRYLPSFMPFLLVPLMLLCTRPNFPLKPQLPKQDFSLIEWWRWFGGAVACGLILLGCAYGAEIRGALELFQAFAIGVATWAFIFLACRDCRRTIHNAKVT
jgi:sterol desaturase/sphingolipid hydroxylase (fatty acid hydroxylase superfamily)